MKRQVSPMFSPAVSEITAELHSWRCRRITSAVFMTSEHERAANQVITFLTDIRSDLVKKLDHLNS